MKKTLNDAKCPICFYHNVTEDFACPDGLASAWVVKQKYPQIDCQGLMYYPSDVKEDQAKEIFNYFDGFLFMYDFLLFVDFSLPVEVLKLFYKNKTPFLILDHHETTYNKFFNTPLSKRLGNKYIYDNNLSGATLTWEYLFPAKPTPLFLKYIQDYDLYTKELPMADIIRCGMSKLFQSFALYDQLYVLDEDSFYGLLIPIGTPVWEKKQEKINKIIRLRSSLDFENKIAFVDILSGEAYLKSLVAERLLQKHPEIEIVCEQIRKDSRIRIKARKNKPLSRIFKDLPNLGGHTNSINFDCFDNWEQQVIKTLSKSAY